MKRILTLIALFLVLNLSANEKILIGATPVPHAEILELIKPNLAKNGYDLEIVEFNDYVIPNYSLEKGEIDAHFLIGLPYMKEFNAQNGTHMFAVVGVHIEPLGIYSNKISSLDELKDGAQVTLPNDVSTETRALRLLEKFNLIKLENPDSEFITTSDIYENPKGLKFTTLEPASVPRTITDTDIAVINTNYALLAGLNPGSDALGLEGSESPYVNYLIVKEGNENKAYTKALKDALMTDEVRNFINEKYKGAVLPAF
ncbi:MAG: MetQ/NlpA family ABC transporter substrate-binding protein [Campylobacter sp.]|nr:MetQ/NlpA family ABC transporter substrate-binding protein [Campylobacter sp.]